MLTADKLREIFRCKNDEELGRKFQRGAKAVSVWRRKGLPPAIEKRAEEMIQQIGTSGSLQGKTFEAENIHIDIHNGHVTHETQADYGIKPIERELLDDWRGLSEVGQMKSWTYIKQVKAEEGK